MTDADTLSELVRVGLRNPARITVKVQSKRLKAGSTQRGEIIEERRIPAKCVYMCVCGRRKILMDFSLHNYYIDCRSSEKLVQLIRIVSHETSTRGSSHFIVYFATCACVDYFFKVRSSP
jgi:ATP-dependent RNA helicase DDX55/SPB4